MEEVEARRERIRPAPSTQQVQPPIAVDVVDDEESQPELDAPVMAHQTAAIERQLAVNIDGKLLAPSKAQIIHPKFRYAASDGRPTSRTLPSERVLRPRSTE